MKHADLIARLEKLTGPDREVDIAIGKAFPPATIQSDGSWFEKDDFVRFPAVTASLDAAVTLVERMLPGWTIANIGQDDRKHWHAELRQGFLTSFSTVKLAGAPTPAIALLIALLRALQESDTAAKESDNDR